jgi:hypothetical protein
MPGADTEAGINVQVRGCAKAANRKPQTQKKRCVCVSCIEHVLISKERGTLWEGGRLFEGFRRVDEIGY